MDANIDEIYEKSSYLEINNLCQDKICNIIEFLE